MSYATPAELRSQIDQSTTDDATLQAILDAADLVIDRFCNRPDGFLSDEDASARTYSGSGETVQWIDECTSVTLVAVKDSPTDTSYTSWDTTDYILASGDPDSPDFNSTPYSMLLIDPGGNYDSFTDGTYTGKAGFKPNRTRSRGVPTVQVTAKWGYATATPPNIKQAAILQSARWYKRMRAGGADVLLSPEFGVAMYQQQLDPDVRHMLIGARMVRPTVG